MSKVWSVNPSANRSAAVMATDRAGSLENELLFVGLAGQALHQALVILIWKTHHIPDGWGKVSEEKQNTKSFWPKCWKSMRDGIYCADPSSVFAVYCFLCDITPLSSILLSLSLSFKTYQISPGCRSTWPSPAGSPAPACIFHHLCLHRWGSRGCTLRWPCSAKTEWSRRSLTPPYTRRPTQRK